MSSDFPIPEATSIPSPASSPSPAPTRHRPSSKVQKSLKDLLEEKPCFSFLGTKITFPTQVTKDNSNTFEFRAGGIPQSVITAMNPYSLEFESSINWGDPVFSPVVSEYRVVHPHGSTDVASSDVASSFLRRLNECARNVSFATIDNTGILSRPHAKACGLFDLMGRTSCRPEHHYSMEGIYSTGTLIQYLTFALMHPRVVSPQEMPSKDQLKDGKITVGIRRRLINVFKHPEEESVCLTYLMYYKSTSGPSTGKANLAHFWVGISDLNMKILSSTTDPAKPDKTTLIKAGTNDEFPMGYVAGGLSKLASLLYFASLGIDLETLTFPVEIWGKTVNIKVDREFSDLYRTYSGSGLGAEANSWAYGVNSGQYSFVLPTSSPPSTWAIFGVKSDKTSGILSRVESPFLERVQGFNQLRNLLLAESGGKVSGDSRKNLNETKALLSASRSSFLQSFLNSKEFLSRVLREQSKELAEDFKKTREDVSGMGYKDLLQFLAEPEFRKHLKV